MSFPSIDPTTTDAWQKLKAHFAEIKDQKVQDSFKENPDRCREFSMTWEDFYIDYSKNRISQTTKDLLMQLAGETGLKRAIEAQFSGEKINKTEGRAVLHTELRNFENLSGEVKETLEKMKDFSGNVINGTWKGYTGKPITDVVNIGIGGSDLGPDMVTEALKYYKNHLEVHYVSNVDGDHVREKIKTLNRETTLFIIVSKSFSTQETLTNANTIKNWFLEKAQSSAVKKHFVAVSTNIEAVKEYGIAEENIFPMWDWVGGRFSLWSAVGLSICCATGFDNFEKLLKGAQKMDVHFRETPFEDNIPVVLALLSVWYNNFFKSESEAIVPYCQYLSKLVPYLQQAVMESNGKSVDRNGKKVTYQTGNIIWGSTGTNAQHAFFQLLHQGTKLIPADFIVFAEALHKNDVHHEILKANCFAQTEALLLGTYREKLENPYREFDGNKPTTTILIRKLTPQNLGSLIALYEHKIFVQGVILNIFSFDQWGVELGKKIAEDTLKAIQEKQPEKVENASSRELIKMALKLAD